MVTSAIDCIFHVNIFPKSSTSMHTNMQKDQYFISYNDCNCKSVPLNTELLKLNAKDTELAPGNLIFLWIPLGKVIPEEAGKENSKCWLFLKGMNQNLSHSWTDAWLESDETGNGKHYCGMGKEVGSCNILTKTCQILKKSQPWIQKKKKNQ